MELYLLIVDQGFPYIHESCIKVEVNQVHPPGFEIFVVESH